MLESAIELFATLAGTVDAQKGIISGVSVITMGEAKGHNLWIDETTLSQVMAAGQAFERGVKVKIDHKSGFAGIVGSLRNFRIEGEQVKGDLHLLKSHDAFDNIIELASDIPDTFGLSISFSGKPEKKEARKCARCTELYSIDLVDQPAANPAGLFSVPIDSNQPPMQLDKILPALKKFFSTPEGRELATELSVPTEAPTVPKADYDGLATKLTTAQTDLATAQGKVVSLEAEKKTATDALDARNKEFATAVTELAGKQAATILTKLSIQPIRIDAENPNPDAKTLLAEYNSITDPVKKTAFYAKYGGSNIVNNLRKPAASSEA